MDKAKLEIECNIVAIRENDNIYVVSSKVEGEEKKIKS